MLPNTHLHHPCHPSPWRWCWLKWSSVMCVNITQKTQWALKTLHYEAFIYNCKNGNLRSGWHELWNLRARFWGFFQFFFLNFWGLDESEDSISFNPKTALLNLRSSILNNQSSVLNTQSFRKWKLAFLRFWYNTLLSTRWLMNNSPLVFGWSLVPVATVVLAVSSAATSTAFHVCACKCQTTAWSLAGFLTWRCSTFLHLWTRVYLCFCVFVFVYMHIRN